MLKDSPTAQRHADLVRTRLLEASPDGLTLKELMGACELSRWQTRRALAALKDLCAAREWPPAIWTRAAGYHFCGSEEELQEWERAWISERLTQFRRMLTGTLGPHLALFPDSAWATYLNTQMRAIETNLEMAARVPH